MKFILYQDHNDRWRWRVKAKNGRIIGAASQGYSDKQDAILNAERLGKVLHGSVDWETAYDV